MQVLKQSTASQVIQLGPFVDDTDFKTAETALSIANTDIKLRTHAATSHASKNSGGATHIANGYYHSTLDATDTATLGRLDVSVNVAGALPVYKSFMVEAAGKFDFGYSATGAIPSFGVLSRGTAQSATGTTLVLAASDDYANDVLIGSTVLAFGATQGYWQSRQITGYVLSTDTVTVDAWTVTPSGTITYVVLGSPPASVSSPTQVALVDGAITAAKIATGAITAAKVAADAIGASQLATDAVDEIADGLLNRNMATGTDSGSTTVRTVRQALRALRNKVSVSGGTATVTKEDDSTASWTAAVTGTPTVTAVDPAGP